MQKSRYSEFYFQITTDAIAERNRGKRVGVRRLPKVFTLVAQFILARSSQAGTADSQNFW
jgi:hypothetical protein